jgi:hypothetical protein
MLSDAEKKARINGYSSAALSADYWHAAYVMQQDGRNHQFGHLHSPKYNCLCISAELAMKAFLYLHGKPQKQIRGFGHNLPELYNACHAIHPMLNAISISAIMLMHKTYYKHYWRYGMDKGEGEVMIAQEEPLFVAVAQLVDLATGDPGVLRNARGVGPTRYFVWPVESNHPRIAPHVAEHQRKDEAARSAMLNA